MALLGKKTEEGKVATAPSAPSSWKGVFAAKILKKPRMTEKAYLGNTRNQYTFEVFPDATKASVKRAVEAIYGVHVETVNITRIPARTRRFGRSVGKESSIKKAVIRIKQGESIALFQAGL